MDPLKLCVFLFFLSKIKACTEIRDSQMVTFKTNRLVLSTEGETLIPIVIDLVEYYTICGQKYRSDVLPGMFRSLNDRSPKSVHLPRTKRIVPLIAAAAVGLGAAAWMAYEYSEINGQIDELREEEARSFNYLRTLTVKEHRESFENFLVVRREMSSLSEKARQTACNVEKNITMFIFEHKFMQEFDDIITSLHTERFTTKIIPPGQLYELIRKVPQLHDTIYQKLPYLLYYTGRVSFNLNEVNGDILRGVLVVPLIKRSESVSMHVAVRKINNELKMFKPVFVADSSQLSVEGCHRELDHYFCTDTDLQEIRMTELTATPLYNDGVVLLNRGQKATIRNLKRNSTIRTITGPAVCSHEDTASVIVNDQMVYTQASEFHIRQETIDFSIDLYPLKLEFENKAIETLETRLTVSEQKATLLHSTHFVVAMMFAFVLVFSGAFIIHKLKRHAKTVKNMQEKDIPLQDIIIIEDPATGNGRARHIRRA